MTTKTVLATTAGVVFVFAHAASAHPGHAAGGFAAGVSHPLLGFDHVLAMTAVGLYAARTGGRAVWLLPATFLLLMAGGALLGLAGGPVPAVEQAIAASVLLLGLLIAAGSPLPVPATAALVGLFAVFHGFAHGSEMPAFSAGGRYAAGFLLATTALHGGGVALGTLLKRIAPTLVSRLAGWGIALCGLLLLCA